MNLALFYAFPSTNNAELMELKIPYRLTLQEFNNFPVSTNDCVRRKQIYDLEASMHAVHGSLTGDLLDSVLIPIHRFSQGIYIRELTIPKGVVIMGKRHAQEHFVSVIAGSCLVATERGVQEMIAPYTFTSPAGEKRVVLATEDTTWITIHRTNETELDAVERDLIISEPDREQLYAQIRNKFHGELINA